MRSSKNTLPVRAGDFAAAPSQPVVTLDQILSPGISLAQLWAIVRARWKQSVGIALLTLLACSVVIKLLPKTYTASAAVILNYEVNDPLGGREFPLGLLTSYIVTQIEIIQGAQVLGPVIDALGLIQNKEYTSGYSGDGSDLREWVMESLRSHLEVRPSWNGGQLIYITASARTADESAAIANAVADTYLGQQVQRVNAPASEQETRYAAQVQEMRNGLTRTQEQIARFRNDTRVVDIDGSGGVDGQLLASLEQRYQEAQNLRRAAEVRQARSGATSELTTAQRGELAQLQTTLGPNHPRVRQLRSNIEAIEFEMARDADAELIAARQLEAKLGAATEQARAELISLRGDQAEGAKLLLELESARAVYKRALDGYDQIKAAARGKYSNVSLLSRAPTPVKAARPNKPKLMVLAALLSLGIGLFGPLIYEFLLDRRIRCVRDVERELGVPVLAEFESVGLAVARP